MLVVIDSGLGNLFSVEAALRRLGAEPLRTDDPALIAKADRVIFPGVGAAAPAMESLRAKGLVDVLRGLTKPMLGICLGMQLMFEASDEGEGAACLGLLQGRVTLLPGLPSMPVPHMGWNQIAVRDKNHPLLRGIEDGSWVYFVHSYAVEVCEATLATSTYSVPFTAAAGLGNFMGCQFHPERSGEVGARVLKNFLEI
jgi:glutamine amidotransferase